MRPRANRIRKILTAVAAFLCPLLLQAQVPAGQLRIDVKDPSGSAIPAAGRLTGPGGTDQTFQTDAAGVYAFSGLPLGRYRLQVTRPGFATQSLTVDVPSAIIVTRTVTLELAAQATRVDVVAATPLPGTDLPIDSNT